MSQQKTRAQQTNPADRTTNWINQGKVEEDLNQDYITTENSMMQRKLT